MKKHIITLTTLICLFTAPLYAEEATPQKKVSENTIDKAAKKIAYFYCVSSSPAYIATTIYDCYDQIDINSPEIEKCILLDTFFQFGLDSLHRKIKALGGNVYDKENIPFTQSKAYEQRFDKNMKLPRFKHLKTKEQQEQYFKSGLAPLEKNLKERCQKNDLF